MRSSSGRICTSSSSRVEPQPSVRAPSSVPGRDRRSRSAGPVRPARPAPAPGARARRPSRAARPRTPGSTRCSDADALAARTGQRGLAEQHVPVGRAGCRRRSARRRGTARPDQRASTGLPGGRLDAAGDQRADEGIVGRCRRAADDARVSRAGQRAGHRQRAPERLRLVAAVVGRDHQQLVLLVGAGSEATNDLRGTTSSAGGHHGCSARRARHSGTPNRGFTRTRTVHVSARQRPGPADERRGGVGRRPGGCSTVAARRRRSWRRPRSAITTHVTCVPRSAIVAAARLRLVGHHLEVAEPDVAEAEWELLVQRPGRSGRAAQPRLAWTLVSVTCSGAATVWVGQESNTQPTK